VESYEDKVKSKRENAGVVAPDVLPGVDGANLEIGTTTSVASVNLETN
jgi:hypothetical protein